MFQKVTTRRILETVPKLKHIAAYHELDDGMIVGMRDYSDWSFTYVLILLFIWTSNPLTERIIRDWVIPRDAAFLENYHEKRNIVKE